MDVIERDRAESDALLSLDARRRPLAREGSADDVACLFGLIVAERVAGDVVARRLSQSESGFAQEVANMLASKIIPADDWSLFHRLWYRWKIPFGAASLAWWYLFCAAMKEAGEPGPAHDLFEEWLEGIEASEIVDRVAVYSALTGIPADGGIVAVHDDIMGMDCFVAAALRGAPLIRLRSKEERARYEDAGVRIGFSDLDPDHHARLPISFAISPPSRPIPNLAALCLGRDPAFGDPGSEMRKSWNELLAEDRTFLLVQLEQRICALEQVRFSHGDETIDNDGIAAILKTCRRDAPTAWTRQQLRVASAIWIWQEAGFVLQELNQAELSLASIRVFLVRRIAEYERATGRCVSTELSLIDLARQFAALRAVVERSYLRCLYFDGGNWERREFLIARADCGSVLELPASLKYAMRERFGLPMPEAEPSAALKLYLGQILERSYTPSELLIALAEWAANASDLPLDYAIFTVPLGVKLDEPWELALDEVFCYTAFRAGFDPKQASVPLDFIGIRNAIGQRLRYNSVKKAQNYALVKRMKPQSFNLPDIAVGEDAHQGGHFAAGLRHTCRIPMTVNHCGSEWKGIADVRLNRAIYDDDSRFSERDLLLATRYAAWSKAVTDEAIARGLLFDRLYCVNLDDGRNVAARLGRA